METGITRWCQIYNEDLLRNIVILVIVILMQFIKNKENKYEEKNFLS